MSKYTKERINEIKKFIDVIKDEINKGISPEVYLNSYRLPLNLSVIQAIFGTTFINPNKEGKSVKIKFNHSLANIEELAELSHILDDFIGNVENPFFNQNNEYNDIDEDIDIPANCLINSIPNLEKVNNKKINEYIFGTNSISKMMISGRDIYDLAAVAQKIKKTKIRNTMLLVGGIALVITGGAVAKS